LGDVRGQLGERARLRGNTKEFSNYVRKWMRTKGARGTKQILNSALEGHVGREKKKSRGKTTRVGTEATKHGSGRLGKERLSFCESQETAFQKQRMNKKGKFGKLREKRGPLREKNESQE